MPLTRFPDHEGHRVFLTTTLSFNLAPPESAFTDRISVALLWLEAGSQATSELTTQFALELLDGGALGVLLGGSAAAQGAEVFQRAASEGEYPIASDETPRIVARPGLSLEQVLFVAAEEMMPPDAWAEEAWDIVVWARSGDPILPPLRDALGRLGSIVEQAYDEGFEESA